MGYSTNFEGVFLLDRPLEPAHRAYLSRFAQTRRLRRDLHLLESEPDPLRVGAGLPLGPEGAFFVGDQGPEQPGVIDPDAPPAGQPGLRCHWTPTEDGRGLQWDGQPDFADYVEWLEYLQQHLLGPWGYAVEGEVTWQGQSEDDRGTLRLVRGRVQARDEGPLWAA